VAHRVERIRNDEDDRVRRVLERRLGHGADDLLVRRHEVVPAHARGAWLSGCDHDHLGARGVLVAVRARQRRLVAEHGAGLCQVERLSLRQALHDVDDDDLGVIATGHLLRHRRADVSRADHSDPAPHTVTPIRSMMASATSLVPTAVGSSRVGFMS
jgi:hypothetical protein